MDGRRLQGGRMRGGVAAGDHPTWWTTTLARGWEAHPWARSSAMRQDGAGARRRRPDFILVGWELEALADASLSGRLGAWGVALRSGLGADTWETTE